MLNENNTKRTVSSMSGLSKSERNGFLDMLKMLSNADLLALSDTVTNKKITVESTKEAMEAIMLYSQNAEELLKRKKVHRDIIFKYLAKHQVVVSPTAEKSQLVKTTLEFWRSGKVLKSMTFDAAMNLRDFASLKEQENISDRCVEDSLFDCLAFGKQFCQWFFQVLNSQNPSLGDASEDWGPQHFWDNVEMKLQSFTEEEQVGKFRGAECVSLRLLALVKDERLLFSPNLESHGLRCLSSPHGLVVVAVAGTIHREQTCLGIFEQVFGLIRLPLENSTWKVKSVHLTIRGQKSRECPAAPALSYDSRELQLLVTEDCE